MLSKEQYDIFLSLEQSKWEFMVDNTPNSLISDGEWHFLKIGLHYYEKETIRELVTMGFDDLYQVLWPIVDQVFDLETKILTALKFCEAKVMQMHQNEQSLSNTKQTVCLKLLNYITTNPNIDQDYGLKIWGL